MNQRVEEEGKEKEKCPLIHVMKVTFISISGLCMSSSHLHGREKERKREKKSTQAIGSSHSLSI